MTDQKIQERLTKWQTLDSALRAQTPGSPSWASIIHYLLVALTADTIADLRAQEQERQP